MKDEIIDVNIHEAYKNYIKAAKDYQAVAGELYLKLENLKPQNLGNKEEELYTHMHEIRELFGRLENSAKYVALSHKVLEIEIFKETNFGASLRGFRLVAIDNLKRDEVYTKMSKHQDEFYTYLKNAGKITDDLNNISQTLILRWKFFDLGKVKHLSPGYWSNLISRHMIVNIASNLIDQDVLKGVLDELNDVKLKSDFDEDLFYIK